MTNAAPGCEDMEYIAEMGVQLGIALKDTTDTHPLLNMAPKNIFKTVDMAIELRSHAYLEHDWPALDMLIDALHRLSRYQMGAMIDEERPDLCNVYEPCLERLALHYVDPFNGGRLGGVCATAALLATKEQATFCDVLSQWIVGFGQSSTPTLTFDRLALIVRYTSALANGSLLTLASQAFDDGGLVMRTIEEGADERAFKRVLFVAGTLNPTDRLIGFIVLPLLHYGGWQLNGMPSVKTTVDEMSAWYSKQKTNADPIVRALSLQTFCRVCPDSWRAFFLQCLERSFTDGSELVVHRALVCLPHAVLVPATRLRRSQLFTRLVRTYVGGLLDTPSLVPDVITALTNCVCAIDGDRQVHDTTPFSTACADCHRLEGELPQLTEVLIAVMEKAMKMHGDQLAIKQLLAAFVQTVATHMHITTMLCDRFADVVVIMIGWLPFRTSLEFDAVLVRSIAAVCDERVFHSSTVQALLDVIHAMNVGFEPDLPRKEIHMISAVLRRNPKLYLDDGLFLTLLFKLLNAAVLETELPDEDEEMDTKETLALIDTARETVEHVAGVMELNVRQFYDHYAHSIWEFFVPSMCKDVEMTIAAENDENNENVASVDEFVVFVLRRFARFLPIAKDHLAWLKLVYPQFVAQVCMQFDRQPSASRLHTVMCQLAGRTKTESIRENFPHILVAFACHKSADTEQFESMLAFLHAEMELSGEGQLHEAVVSSCSLQCYALQLSYVSIAPHTFEATLKWLNDSRIEKGKKGHFSWNGLCRRQLVGVLFAMQQMVQLTNSTTATITRVHIVESLKLIYTNKLTDKQQLVDTSTRVMLILQQCREVVDSTKSGHLRERFNQAITDAWYALVGALPIDALAALLPQLLPYLMNGKNLTSTIAYIFNTRRHALTSGCVYWNELCSVLKKSDVLSEYIGILPNRSFDWQINACLVLIKLDHRQLTAHAVKHLRSLLSSSEGQKFVASAITSGISATHGAVVVSCVTHLTGVLKSAHSDQATQVDCVAAMGAIGANARLMRCSEQFTGGTNGRFQLCKPDHVVFALVDETSCSEEYGRYVLSEQCIRLMSNLPAQNHDVCQFSIQLTLAALNISDVVLKKAPKEQYPRAIAIWESLTTSQQQTLTPMLSTKFFRRVDTAAEKEKWKRDTGILFGRYDNRDDWMKMVAHRLEDRLPEIPSKLFDGLTLFATVTVWSFAVDHIAQIVATVAQYDDKTGIDFIIEEFTSILRWTEETELWRDCAMAVCRCMDVLKQLLARLNMTDRPKPTKAQLTCMRHCRHIVATLEGLRYPDGRSVYVQVAITCQSYARAFAAQSEVIRRARPVDVPLTQASASPAIVDAEKESKQLFILEGIASRLFARDDVSGALEAISTMRTPTDAEHILYYEAMGNYTDALPFYALSMEKTNIGQCNVDFCNCMLKLNQVHTVQTYLKGLQRTGRDAIDSQFEALGIEASIRLQDWDGLKEAVDCSQFPNTYKVAVGGAFAEMARVTVDGGGENADEWLYKARLALVNPFRDATMHVDIAYERSYHHVRRMHALFEMETVYACLTGRRPVQTLEAEWEARLNVVESTSTSLHPLLESRRALVHLLAPRLLDDPTAQRMQQESWIRATQVARVEGHSESAWSLHVFAKQYAVPSVAGEVELAKLYWQKGKQRDALACFASIVKEHGDERESAAKYAGDEAEKVAMRDMLTKAFGLRARYTAMACEADKNDIVRMHCTLTKYFPCEKTYYEAACFNDTLMTEGKKTEIAAAVIRMYRLTMVYGSAYTNHAMPRMITIWLERTDIGNIRNGQSKSVEYIRAAEKSARECQSQMEKAVSQVSTYHYYVAISLLLSRVTHPNPATSRTVAAILARLIIAYPHQSLWQVLASTSAKKDGKSGADLRAKVVADLLENVNKTNKDIYLMFCNMHALGEAFTTLAVHKEPDGVRSMNMKQRCGSLFNFFNYDKHVKLFAKYDAAELAAANRAPHKKAAVDVVHPPLPLESRSCAKVGGWPLRIIMPIRQQLEAVLPHTATEHSAANQMSQGMSGTTQTQTQSVTHSAFDTSNLLFMESFDDAVTIYSSLQQPKLVRVRCSDGNVYSLMCKAGDDLRLDKRLNEFNTVVNECLRHSTPSRVRRLHVRTFEVTMLADDAGLIEFVPNHRSFRHVQTTTMQNMLREESPETTKWNSTIKFGPGPEYKTDDERKKHAILRREIANCRPVMAEYLARTYTEPCGWLQARQNYIRTTAVMSMVGYVIGLGDRHGENILIDEHTAQVMHVDFNMLFDRAWTLAVPEIVPFRLTRQVVDGFGATGVHGEFRVACETTMTVLREHRDMLLTSFMYDPCAEWTVSTKRKHINAPDAPSQCVRVTLLPTATSTNENLTAARNLFNCDRKLKGGVLRCGMKNAEECDLISVGAQVSELIRMATDEHRLCMMWWGWAPYL